MVNHCDDDVAPRPPRLFLVSPTPTFSKLSHQIQRLLTNTYLQLRAKASPHREDKKECAPGHNYCCTRIPAFRRNSLHSLITYESTHQQQSSTGKGLPLSPTSHSSSSTANTTNTTNTMNRGKASSVLQTAVRSGVAAARSADGSRFIIQQQRTFITPAYNLAKKVCENIRS